jgi:hypothetical protein
LSGFFYGRWFGQDTLVAAMKVALLDPPFLHSADTQVQMGLQTKLTAQALIQLRQIQGRQIQHVFDHDGVLHLNVQMRHQLPHERVGNKHGQGIETVMQNRFMKILGQRFCKLAAMGLFEVCARYQTSPSGL